MFADAFMALRQISQTMKWSWISFWIGGIFGVCYMLAIDYLIVKLRNRNG